MRVSRATLNSPECKFLYERAKKLYKQLRQFPSELDDDARFSPLDDRTAKERDRIWYELHHDVFLQLASKFLGRTITAQTKPKNDREAETVRMIVAEIEAIMDQDVAGEDSTNRHMQGNLDYFRKNPIHPDEDDGPFRE